MAVSERYQNEIRENEKIEYAGLTLYPLTVRDYALYSSAKPSIELMQSSLPPQFARLSWCVCLDEMDKYNAEHGTATYYLSAFLHVLVKALRLPPIHGRNGETSYPIRPIWSEDTGRLTSIFIATANGQDAALISMAQAGEIRHIIAAQNLYEIPDESWNPDLLRAAQYTEQAKKQASSMTLKALSIPLPSTVA